MSVGPKWIERSWSRAAAAVTSLLLLSGCVTARDERSSPTVDPSKRVVNEITFRARDGYTLKGVVSSPPGEGPFPVLLSVHGGAGDRPIEVMANAAAPDSDSPTTRMFNSQNWIVFAPDYRNDWFGSEETDLVDAVRFAATLPNADPDRIAVFGGSNGGRVSLRAAITDPTALRCLAIGSPFLTDPDVFFARDTTRPPWSLLSSGANAWISATRDRLILAAGRSAQRQSLTRDELFMQRSIVRNAGKIRAPVLLMTSRADEQVPHVMLESLIGALETAGRPARVVTVEKSLHGFYWGREGEFGAREGRGPRTAEQLEEETRVRDEALEFLSHCLGSPARH